MEKKILIEVILTKQCNKRCEFCVVDFSDSILKRIHIDRLISLIKASDTRFTLNFFWGEPLLEFSSIEHILEGLKENHNIRYTLGTNWVLLDSKKFEYLCKNHIEIYLSFDETFDWNVYEKNPGFPKYENLIINFIINPSLIEMAWKNIDKLIHFGYRKFNFIPVYISMDWTKEQLILLKKFITYIRDSYDKQISYEFFSYFQNPTSEYQFILEHDGTIYRDIHSHFWFLKQAKNVPALTRERIEEFTKVNHINNINNITEILEWYDYKYLLTESFWSIPKELWLYRNLEIIDRLIA